MRHILWLMPLMLCTGLMICCYNIPSKDNNREFLAVLFLLISLIGAFMVRAETQSERTV